MQAVGGGRKSPCSGNVVLFEETCLLTTLVGLVIAVLFLTKGFHMDGHFFLDFFFIPHPPFCLFFLGGCMIVGEGGLGNVGGSFVIKAEKWVLMSGSY